MPRLILVYLIFWFTSFFGSETFALEPKRLFKETRDSVVLIMSFDKYNQPLAIGSGFFIEDGNKIVTNYHVIAGTTSVRIKLTNGSVSSINTVLGINTEQDLAILESSIKGNPLTLSIKTPEIGQDIIAIGNPIGLEGTLSVGIVSGLRNDEDLVYYQVTAPISPGSSGGPIINEFGEVIGVSTFFVEGGQNLNFAMPAIYIKDLIRNPSRLAISKIPRLETPSKMSPVEKNVSIIEPYIDGCSGQIKISVLNRSNSDIYNTRLIAVFYSNEKSSIPIHYMHINISEGIPSNLAKRFARFDNMLKGHGHGLLGSICGKEGEWVVKFRILDYQIIEVRGWDD